MQFAEDCKKVDRIVAGSQEGLNTMYPDEALLDSFPAAKVRRSPGRHTGDATSFARSTEEAAQVALLQELPMVRQLHHLRQLCLI